MITIIGTTLGIPDTVMGLTFVAAGVSIPDALSSIAVIKEGHGDMAVSNAVGSNVFDILICLGLPWLIQTTILDPGGHVNVISKGTAFNLHCTFSEMCVFFLFFHIDLFFYITIHRLDLLNIEFIVDGGVFVAIGALEWVEIGQTPRHHTHGLVLFVHCIGINV